MELSQGEMLFWGKSLVCRDTSTSFQAQLKYFPFSILRSGVLYCSLNFHRQMEGTPWANTSEMFIENPKKCIKPQYVVFLLFSIMQSILRVQSWGCLSIRYDYTAEREMEREKEKEREGEVSTSDFILPLPWASLSPGCLWWSQIPQCSQCRWVGMVQTLGCCTGGNDFF